MNKPIVIRISRIKTFFLMLASLAFVILGVYLIFFKNIKPDMPIFLQQNFWLVQVIGILAIFFFGTTLYLSVQKFINRQEGLRIDEKGITDNSSASSVGFISWNNVIGLEKKQILSNRFFLVQVNNPKDFIQRAEHAYLGRLLQANYNTYHTPITIISNTLAIEYSELEDLLIQEFQKRGKEVSF